MKVNETPRDFHHWWNCEVGRENDWAVQSERDILYNGMFWRARCRCLPEASVETRSGWAFLSYRPNITNSGRNWTVYMMQSYLQSPAAGQFQCGTYKSTERNVRLETVRETAEILQGWFLTHQPFRIFSRCGGSLFDKNTCPKYSRRMNLLKGAGRIFEPSATLIKTGNTILRKALMLYGMVKR